MTNVKINIADPESAETKAEDNDNLEALVGQEIGNEVDGSLLGYDGYVFEITGGSDDSGFPMRKDVPGSDRKKVLITEGVGLRKNRKGNKRRRTVVGNTINQKTAQVNLKVVEKGDQPLFEDSESEDEE